MSAASMFETSAASKQALRVAVIAPTERQTELGQLIAKLGHRLTDLDDAEVLLCAGELPPTDKPALILGSFAEGGPTQVAARLPALASEAQIDAALRAIAVGLQVRVNADEFKLDAPSERVPVLLTPRELQILTAISDGASNKTIARDLSISLHTVKFHVESLFRKLNVRTRAEAVAKGLERRRGQIEV